MSRSAPCLNTALTGLGACALVFCASPGAAWKVPVRPGTYNAVLAPTPSGGVVVSTKREENQAHFVVVMSVDRGGTSCGSARNRALLV